MAVVEVVGQTASRTIDGGARISNRYSVTGATSESEAETETYNYLATLGRTLLYNGLAFDGITTDEEEDSVYYTTATWRTFSRAQPRQIGDDIETDFSFNISTIPVSVKLPQGTIEVFKAGETADFVPQLLNDVGDGEEPDGVDIYEPSYEESKTIIVPTSSLTPAYRTKLKQSVGKTNLGTFQGWAEGEVLMTGISGTRRGASDSELNFRWQVRENEDNLTIAGIQGISKKGWDYLWPRAETRSTANAPMVKTITHICVARIFKQRTFNDLGI